MITLRDLPQVGATRRAAPRRGKPGLVSTSCCLVLSECPARSACRSPGADWLAKCRLDYPRVVFVSLRLSHFGPFAGQSRLCESPRAMSSTTAPATTPIPQNGTVSPRLVPQAQRRPREYPPPESRAPDRDRSAEPVRNHALGVVFHLARRPEEERLYSAAAIDFLAGYYRPPSSSAFEEGARIAFKVSGLHRTRYFKERRSKRHCQLVTTAQGEQALGVRVDLRYSHDEPYFDQEMVDEKDSKQ